MANTTTSTRANLAVRMTAPGGFAEGHISFLFGDSEGTLWLRQGDRLASLQDGQFVVLCQPHSNEQASVTCALPCRKGGLGVITPEALRRLHGSQEAEES